MTSQAAFSPWTLQQIQILHINARMHQVEMASISEGRVTEGRQLGLRHFVNLPHGTCTFHIYQDLGLPYQHACTRLHPRYSAPPTTV